MNIKALANTANEMVSNGKALLAIDESIGTCNKRFAQWHIPQNAETRRQYRELIVNTPGFAESIGGVILTMRPFGNVKTMALRSPKPSFPNICHGIPWRGFKALPRSIY